MRTAGVISNLLYIFTDALRSLRENLVTTLLTSVTLAFTLAIFFLFLSAFINLDRVVETLGDRTRVVAYIKDGAIRGGAAGVKSARTGLTAISGVKSVKYISKDDALAELKAALKGHEGIIEGIDSNPLPASFEMTVEDAYRDEAGLQGVVESLSRKPWVEDVEYSREWVEKVAALIKFAEFAALTIGLFLVAATVFIISNTIRLTVYARRDEIEVMRLVGASNFFVKLPFFLEGVAQGLLGGVMALGVLSLARYIVVSRVPPYMGFIADPPASLPVLLVLIVITGVVMGVVGSLISMGRFLKT